jgi:hypothetical protein
MEKLLALINGKKTYVVAICIAICAGLVAAGIPIPEWVWLLLNAAGFGAVRDAVEKMKK